MLVPEHNREFLSNKLEADTDLKQYETPEHLYEIGREANTEFQPKDHRETFYSKHKRDISEVLLTTPTTHGTCNHAALTVEEIWATSNPL